MTTIAPISISEFQTHFDRDFIYGTEIDTVRSKDIQAALDNAAMLQSTSIWDSTANAKTAFYLLAAHCLCKLIDSSGGLDQGRGLRSTGKSPIASKGVGGMNISYTLPAELADSPILSDFMTTGYGKMYLQLLTPRLIGNMMGIRGGTNP
jgi:hypothetical protein